MEADGRPSLATRQSRFLLLLIEDDPAREARIRAWLPADVRCVVARSAGSAVGTLRLDRGRVYAIMLDHDLGARCVTEADRGLSGVDVADAIAEYVAREVPILIHSMNPAKAATLASQLRDAGFDVTRAPMASLDGNRLRCWLDDASAALGPEQCDARTE